MTAALELFVLGIAVSFGPCLIHCSSLVLPYLAASNLGWKSSLKHTAVFLSIRIMVYALLGFAAGWIGRIVSISLHEHQRLLFLIGGLIVALFGFLITLGFDPSHRMCRAVRNRYDSYGSRPFVIFALAVSVIPCASLIAVLAYIALQAGSPLTGASFGLAFGAGKLISPILPLGAAVGFLSGKLSLSSSRLSSVLSFLCGVFIIIVGLRLAFFP